MRVIIFFFFSSRRRHTRLQGDWSSDVCSSDLLVRAHEPGASAEHATAADRQGWRDGGLEGGRDAADAVQTAAADTSTTFVARPRSAARREGYEDGRELGGVSPHSAILLKRVL